MDHRLRALEQRVRALPSDGASRARLRAELFRLAPLDDRAAWNRADPGAQELVIDAIGRLLGPAFEAAGAAEFAAGGERHRVGRFVHRASGTLLHLVPGGACLVGSLRGAQNERPRHQVQVAPFLIGRYPLLQAEWDRVGGDDARSWVGPDLPIEQVSWNDVQAWLRRAGSLRLPSEAEWEYACRAGTQTEYFWGDEVDPAWCWFGEGGAWTTHAPCEHDDRPNAFGLVDVSGNVFEWCEDGYAAYSELPRDESGPRRRAGAARVIRGGDGFNRATNCRSSFRSYARATDRGGGIGFRVAASLPL